MVFGGVNDRIMYKVLASLPGFFTRTTHKIVYWNQTTRTRHFAIWYHGQTHDWYECGVASVAMDTVLTFHAAIFASPLTPIVLPWLSWTEAKSRKAVPPYSQYEFLFAFKIFSMSIPCVIPQKIWKYWSYTCGDVLICLFHTSFSTIFFDRSSAVVGQTVWNAKVPFLSWGVWCSGTVVWDGNN